MIIKPIKALFRNALPEKILQIVKKIYYPHLLNSFSENDEVEFKVIKYLINHRDYVVDIGANIGVYTKYLSELVGNHGCVYSFEPIPSTFDILCSNIKKLRLKNVKVINCAISDTDDSVTMEIPLYKTGGENYYEAKIVNNEYKNSLRRVKVESKTIDSLFSELTYNISFIKLDVEGHEFKCIKGAMKTIRNKKPALLIEILEDPDNPKSTAHEIFELLEKESYKAFWFDGININKWCTGNRKVNYFFLTSKHLQVLQEYSLVKLDYQ